MSIKYYQLAKDEELPDEFCAVRDVGGEPSEYTFYVPEAENAKLRELIVDTLMHPREYCEKHGIEYEGWNSVDAHIYARMRELGVEVD